MSAHSVTFSKASRQFDEIEKKLRLPRLPGAKKKAADAANRETWAAVQRDMARTRKETASWTAANNKKRAAVEARGREGDRMGAEIRRAKAVGWTGRSGTNASYTGTPTSRRVTDQFGNSGWA